MLVQRKIDACQDLIANPEKITLTKFPIPLPTFKKRAQFGKEIKWAHFFLDPSWTYLNHGAFGAVVKEVMETVHRFQIYLETQPTRVFDREFVPLIFTVIQRLAKFVKADLKDIVLVPNSTTATTSILKSFPFEAGDGILHLNLAYGAVIKQLTEVARLKSLVLHGLKVNFPLTNASEIISVVEKGLSEFPKVKLAVFDHIASESAIILPIKELIEICHKSGVPVMIDGAHALGNIDINLKDINADFYLSNGHKWFCCAKGSAFLYVKPEFQAVARPLVISHGFTHGFNAEFAWGGVKDYSALIALHTALDFWEFYGPDTIREYSHGLSKKAAAMLASRWNTLLIADASFFRSMSVVWLPIEKKDATVTDADKVQDWLHWQKKIEVPIKVIQGRLAVRISAHVHNEVGDYERLAEAMLEYTKQQDS